CVRCSGRSSSRALRDAGSAPPASRCRCSACTRTVISIAPNGHAMDEPSRGALALPRLELEGMTKNYPAVVANDGIGLTVMPGEIHALLGENGAGKSTLMKIVYGVARPDSGTIRWNGRAVTIRSPAQARRLGIGMVFQHF